MSCQNGKKVKYFSPLCIPNITKEEATFLLDRGVYMGYYDEKKKDFVVVLSRGGVVEV